MTEHELLTYEQARDRAAIDPAMSALFNWLESYPGNPHAELGRPGAICPFTRPSRRLGATRISLSSAGAKDEERAFAHVRRAYADLDRIPVERGKEEFRAVVIAFPNCMSDAGIEMLERVAKQHKYYSIVRFRTIGLLHEKSKAPGLWNPNFHPMRAPMPLVAIRHIVEQDAPFIIDQHLQWAPYLLRFGLPGARRLMNYGRHRRTPPTAVG